MRIETVLNRCYRHKSFVYSSCRWKRIGGKQALVVEVVARKNGLAECSICGRRAPVYDRLKNRRIGSGREDSGWSELGQPAEWNNNQESVGA